MSDQGVFVKEMDMTADMCVAEFCSYLHEIANKAVRLETKQWETSLNRIRQVVKQKNLIGDGYIDAGFLNKNNYGAIKTVARFFHEFQSLSRKYPLLVSTWVGMT